MCGIVAVIGDRGLRGDVLDAMRDRVAHRGPDGAKSWLSDDPQVSVGLGHRRLAIIDLSAAADQPMFTRDRSAVVVYNGEIYNFVELRAELEILGHEFATHSDTEVLLSAYQEWGVDCLSRLNGMFAFVIWDVRLRRLFAARDRFGEKPLFYAELPEGGLALASEMKSLFAHPGLSARADPAGLDRYLEGTYYESDHQTLFRGVLRLPAAHALLISATGRIDRSWRYWTPDFTEVEHGYREREAVERFRELMSKSVSMRLRSDVPVGTSLSGGLDSSTVVALVAGMRDDRGIVSQNTFSGRFDDDPTLSEGPYIDMVVGATGVNAHATTPLPEGLIEESRLLHYHQEEPFLSASIYLQWCVMRLAHQHRTTVILDGQGADELLAGYQFYFPSHQLDLLERGRWWRLLTETAAFSGRLTRAGRLYSNAQRRFNPAIALSLRQLAAHARRPSHPPAGADLAGLPAAEAGGRLRRQRAEALLYNSLPQLLRYADRSAMAWSRETRLPFLDHTLVEWVAGLPDQALVARGWQKLILRRAAEPLLPRAVTWRADKMGYAAPLDVWLRDELREWAHDRLFSGPIVHLEGYDRAPLQKLWDEHQSGTAERSWALWRWISLNEWFQLLEEGRWSRGPEPVTSPSAASISRGRSRRRATSALKS